jgi:ketosteroid isomerase-like protein
MKLLSSLVGILFVFTLALAQTEPGANSGLEAELKSITRAMHDALLRGDKEQLMSFFADDFAGTSYNGYLINKRLLIRNLRTPPPEAKITRDIEDFKVSGSPDAAVVTYRLVEHVEIGGQKTEGEYLYTDTFFKKGGRWQIYVSNATRIEAERKIVKLDPAIYDAYVGHYSLAPNLVFTVTRKGDKLLGKAPDGTKVELLPESETTFFVKGRPGETTFVKDLNGHVTHMIIRTDGDGTKLRKIE